MISIFAPLSFAWAMLTAAFQASRPEGGPSEDAAPWWVWPLVLLGVVAVIAGALVGLARAGVLSRNGAPVALAETIERMFALIVGLWARLIGAVVGPVVRLLGVA